MSEFLSQRRQPGLNHSLLVGNPVFLNPEFLIVSVFKGPNSKNSSDSESWHSSVVQGNVGTPKSHPGPKHWGFVGSSQLVSECELVAAGKPQGGARRSLTATSAMLTALARAARCGGDGVWTQCFLSSFQTTNSPLRGGTLQFLFSVTLAVPGP